jgi:hypothetical protein
VPNTDQGNGNQGQEPGAGNQGQGQEPGSQQDQNGKPGQEPGGQQGGSGTADISTMSEADLRAYAAKVQKDAEDARREAASYRTRATTAEQKVTEAERASMTEAQRVQADLEAANGRAQTLEAQVRDLTTGAATREALSAAGAINAMTAFKTLDLTKVETDDQGVPKPESLAAAIAGLKTSDPYLFRRGATTDAGAGGGQGGAPEGGSSINDFLRGNRG